ncbi:MAG: tRNA (guanine(10)-N(2))-dimethyltransferase [archaeon]|nr:tRNA (guanine(10)-N(2))-dimethyltransferase [archaeon]
MSIFDQSVKVVEGKTVLLVPKVSIESDVTPKMPAFYNIQAKLNRDLSVIIYKAMTRRFSEYVKMADSLASVGARGVRVAVEAPEVDKVFMNDLNPIAIEYAKASAEINGVYGKCSFSVSDACHFLIEHSAPRERFEIVDIDPFGSPAPYLDCAIRAVRDGGMVSITATDTAVLCGLYPNVAARKYFGHSLRTEYCHEIGIRLLLGALAHSAMRLNIGIHPIFSHSTRHYIRIYVTVSSGASYADESMKSLGYILHCFKCGNRRASVVINDNCEECGKKFKIAGPLWLKEIHDHEFLSYSLNMNIDLTKRCKKMMEMAMDEAEMPPTYYIPDKIADDLQVVTPSLNKIMDSIKARGFKATRTVINPKGVKTDAPSPLVVEVIKEISDR